jgi:hypothetical protein
LLNQLEPFLRIFISLYFESSGILTKENVKNSCSKISSIAGGFLANSQRMWVKSRCIVLGIERGHIVSVPIITQG